MSAAPLVSANTVTFSAPFPAIIEAVRDAGFDGLEVWAHDLTNEAGAAEVKRMREVGLKLPALQLLRDYEGCPPEQKASRRSAVIALMDLANKVGAETLLACANTRPDSSGDAGRQIEDLRDLAELAAARGLRIGLEPLAWSRWIDRYETAWARVEAVDHHALGLVVDAFHWFYQATPLAFLDSVPIGKCFGVQLCDARPMKLAPIEIARHHRLFPGEGNWPIKELVGALDRRGYSGFYNLEVFNDEYRTQDVRIVANRAMQSFRMIFDARANGARAEGRLA